MEQCDEMSTNDNVDDVIIPPTSEVCTYTYHPSSLLLRCNAPSHHIMGCNIYFLIHGQEQPNQGL